MIETLGFAFRRLTSTRFEPPPASHQRGDDAAAPLERGPQQLAALGEHLVRRPGSHFVRPDPVAGEIQTVARHGGLKRRREEPRVDLEAGGVAGRLLDAALLLEQEHAEAFEAGVGERFPVLGDVGPEPAGAAGARGEEDVALDDLLDGQTSPDRGDA